MFFFLTWVIPKKNSKWKILLRWLKSEIWGDLWSCMWTWVKFGFCEIPVENMSFRMLTSPKCDLSCIGMNGLYDLSVFCKIWGMRLCVSMWKTSPLGGFLQKLSKITFRCFGTNSCLCFNVVFSSIRLGYRVNLVILKSNCIWIGQCVLSWSWRVLVQKCVSIVCQMPLASFKWCKEREFGGLKCKKSERCKF